MRLHDLLDQVATADAPPVADTDGDTLFTTAVRRRRLTRAVGGGATLVAAIAVVAVTLTVLAPAGGTDLAVNPSGSGSGAPGGNASGAAGESHGAEPSVEETPGRLPGGTWPAYQVGGHGRHLYVFTEQGCYPCPNLLWGSDDGGNTWSFRQTDVVAGDPILVAASGAVASPGFDPATRDGIRTPQVSTDGGRTSRRATGVTSIEGSATGQVVYCARLFALSTLPSPGRSATAPAARLCDVMVLDFRTREFGLLRAQPGIDVNGVWAGESGVVWAAGSVLKGGTRVLAVARTGDGGRTWQTHEFTEAAGALDQVYPDVRVGVEGTVVADFVYQTAGGFKRHIARFRDGAWQRLTGEPLNQADASPLAGTSVSYSFIDSDGRHVLTTYNDGSGSGVTFWAAGRGEQEYRRIDRPAGLPPNTYPEAADEIAFVPGAGYALARQDGLWLSADGKAWRKAILG
jgi:hypothetical protein